MDTCTYRQTWKRSGRSAGERGKQEAAAKSKLSYQEAKTLIRNKRLADFKQRNGGYYPEQDPSLTITPQTDHVIPVKNRSPHEKDWN